MVTQRAEQLCRASCIPVKCILYYDIDRELDNAEGNERQSFSKMTLFVAIFSR